MNRCGLSSLSEVLHAMFQRPLLFLAVLAAAGLIPYILLDKELSATARSQWNSLTGSAGSSSQQETLNAVDQFAASLLEGGSAAIPPQLVVQQNAPIPLEHALRFEVSLPWVTAVFPRVTTVLGDTQLQGLRVPLVSGTQEHDIAGSLTYYFDREQVLRRITFQGYTGDERRVVMFLCSTYGMVAQPTLDRGLYRAAGPNGEVSTLLIRHVPVVSQNAPKQRMELVIDLVRGPLPKGYKLPELRAPGVAENEVVTPTVAPPPAAPVATAPATQPVAATPAATKPAAANSPRPTWRW